MPYENIVKWNIFKNKDVSNNQPPWSNNKVQLDAALEPGTYSVGVYQWDDTGNLSFRLSKLVDNGDAIQPNAPQAQEQEVKDDELPGTFN